MYFTLFVTVVITAVFLVVAAYITAKLLGPRTYNKVKGEPFECDSYTWKLMASYACRLLSLCHSFPYVRCGDRIPLPLGSSS